MLLALLSTLSILFSLIHAEPRLYGPGLVASFQVPVRYFYLETYETNGRK